MKYYAVTEDPNELLHYGVKGMKWGQHIFGKERSPGYHRALGKLRSFTRGTRGALRSAANAIKKSNTQRSIMKEQKQQDKYAQAVAKAQKRIQLTENLHTLDQMKSYERNTNKQYKTEHKNLGKIDRAAAKREKLYAKSEAKMDKYIQQAREGKLKYGKLSDDQVQRITGRLASEKSARSLGSTEKSWRQQKKEAFRQGKLQGITRGTAAAMEEVARAGTIYGIQNFMNRRKMNAVARQEGKEQRLRNRAANKRTHRDIANEIKTEAFEARVREGEGVISRNLLRIPGAASQANYLKKLETRQHEEARKLKLQDSMKDEMDKANNKDYQNMLAKQREQKRLQDIQDKLANEREEKFERKYIDDYGFKNEDSAITAHKNYLSVQADIARNKYGRQSDEAKAAKTRVKEFEGLNKEQQKREMLKLESERDNNKKQEAYNAVVDAIQKRVNHEAEVKRAEEDNARLEKQYNEDMKQYNNDIDYNKKLKQDYTEQMEKWERFENSGFSGKNNPVKKPSQPSYRKVTKPDRSTYGFKKIDYSDPLPSIPNDYKTMKDIQDIGFEELFGFKKPKNNGNGGKKRNK